MLTAARLRELLHYNPETGVFTHIGTGRGRRSGARAGSRTYQGYWQIQVDRQNHKAHRLAWLYVHGSWPELEIDHKNGDKSDNRIANLRVATSSQNSANVGARAGSKSGLKGAHWYGSRGLWRAAIRLGGKSVNLGYFKTPEAAHRAYAAAAATIHGEFARTE